MSHPINVLDMGYVFSRRKRVTAATMVLSLGLVAGYNGCSSPQSGFSATDQISQSEVPVGGARFGYDSKIKDNNLPQQIGVLQPFTLRVTFENSGTQLWKKDKIHLVVKGLKEEGQTDILDLDKDVSPKGYWSASIELTAPNQQGIRKIAVQLESDLIPELEKNFGAFLFEDVNFGPAETDSLEATCIDPTLSTVPAEVGYGQTMNFVVKITNAGSTTWTPSGFKLSASPASLWTPTGLDLAQSVPATGQADFAVSLTSPNLGAAGCIDVPLAFQMHKLGSRHFGQVCEKIIKVCNNPIPQNGLILWLAADRMDNFLENAPLETWKDLSPVNRTATSPAGDRPTQRKDAKGPMNGQKPYVEFRDNYGSGGIVSLTPAPTLTDRYSIFLVLRPYKEPALDELVDNDANKALMMGTPAEANYPLSLGGRLDSGNGFPLKYRANSYGEHSANATLALVPNRWHAFGMTRSADIFTWAIDNGAPASASFSRPVPTFTHIQAYLHGYYLAEFIVYDRTVDATTRASIMNYLVNKYGIIP